VSVARPAHRELFRVISGHSLTLCINSRVSPVEVLYASFPSFLFLNASYGGWLLEPLLEFGGSPRWTYDYAPMDLGAIF
jgi:hypothetical protein